MNKFYIHHFFEKESPLSKYSIGENGSIWDPDFQNDKSYFQKARNREREQSKRDLS